MDCQPIGGPSSVNHHYEEQRQSRLTRTIVVIAIAVFALLAISSDSHHHMPEMFLLLGLGVAIFAIIALFARKVSSHHSGFGGRGRTNVVVLDNPPPQTTFVQVGHGGRGRGMYPNLPTSTYAAPAYGSPASQGGGYVPSSANPFGGVPGHGRTAPAYQVPPQQPMYQPHGSHGIPHAYQAPPQPMPQQPMYQAPVGQHPSGQVYHQQPGPGLSAFRGSPNPGAGQTMFEARK